MPFPNTLDFHKTICVICVNENKTNFMDGNRLCRSKIDTDSHKYKYNATPTAISRFSCLYFFYGCVCIPSSLSKMETEFFEIFPIIFSLHQNTNQFFLSELCHVTSGHRRSLEKRLQSEHKYAFTRSIRLDSIFRLIFPTHLYIIPLRNTHMQTVYLPMAKSLNSYTG